MTNIYDQHAKTFREVSAYVIVDKGDAFTKPNQVAKVAFKFSHSGLRTTCYFHIHGFAMTKGIANGGGYDKASAAASAAVSYTYFQGGPTEEEQRRYDVTLRLVNAIKDEGRAWDADLRAAGFEVWQAV